MHNFIESETPESIFARNAYNTIRDSLRDFPSTHREETYEMPTKNDPDTYQKIAANWLFAPEDNSGIRERFDLTRVWPDRWPQDDPDDYAQALHVTLVEDSGTCSVVGLRFKQYPVLFSHNKQLRISGFLDISVDGTRIAHREMKDEASVSCLVQEYLTGLQRLKAKFDAIKLDTTIS